MISKYNANKNLSVSDIIQTKEATDKPKKILYSAVVLDEQSSKRLLGEFLVLVLSGLEEEIDNFTLTMNNPSTQSEMLMIQNLQTKVSDDSIPEGWKTFAHHMTIVFGKGLPEDLKGDLGKTVTLTVEELGVSNMVMAVKVAGYPDSKKIKSNDNIPHITIAVNVNEGGKPVMSNQITNWKPIENFDITGTVTEVKQN